jgi:hypothetical protein
MDKYAYFSASSLYSNSACVRTATEVNALCVFKGKIVFTDSKAGKVKEYNPADNSVNVLLGSGQERSQDGTQETCSFAQVKGICCLENTLLVTDVSAGAVKLVTGLSNTVTFLKMLGCLFDSFGIHSKGVGVDESVSLQNATENVAKVDKYIQETVSKVKKRYHMKESSVTNGPEGTISHHVSGPSQQGDQQIEY